MRAILAVTVGLALLWGGYWFVGAHQARQMAGSWMAQNDVQGEMTLAGFPNRFDLTVTAPRVSGQDFAYAADFIQILAMSWKPWHMILAFAPEQHITRNGQDWRVTSPHMLGSLQLTPFGGTELRGLRLDGPDIALATAGWQINADHMTLGLEAGANDAAPHFGGHLRGIAPPVSPDGLPARIDSLSIQGHVQLDHPLDTALPPPQVIALDLTQARLIWGDLDLAVSGKLAPDSLGYVSGDLAVTVKGAQDLPPVLQALGLITAKQRDRLAQGLALMGGGELPLSLSDGKIRLGPIPIGTAPIWPR